MAITGKRKRAMSNSNSVRQCDENDHVTATTATTTTTVHNNNNNNNNNNNDSDAGGQTDAHVWPLLDEQEVADVADTHGFVPQLKKTWQTVRSLLFKMETFTEDRHLRGDVPWTYPELMNAYGTVYDLCTQPAGNYFEPRLYRNYSLYLQDYLINRVRPKLQDKEGLQLLVDINGIWKNYRDVFVRLCNMIFRYLGEFFVHTQSVRTLRKEAFYNFKIVVFDDMKADIRSVVLEEIAADRKGQMTNRSLLKDVLVMFHDMGDEEENVYKEDFEDYAAQETKNFYKTLSDDLIADSTLPEYLINAEAKINEEIGRLSAIFTSVSQKRLLNLMDEQLIVARQKELLEMSGSGVEVLVREDKFDDLSRLFRLFNRVEDGILPVANLFRDHIATVGEDLYKKHMQSARSIKDYNKMAKMLIETYVGDLLKLHDRMDDMVRRSFYNNSVFHKALADGFKMFVNQGFKREGSKVELRCAQLFAYFCDDLLRRRSDQLESTVDKVVKFIQFFNEKDVFIEEYKKQLSKRLLSGADSADESDEKSIISKLKYFYQGIGDIYKLEKMLADKAMTSDMKDEFDRFVQKNSLAIPFDLSVTVLTMGTWPISGVETLIPPKEFKEAEKIFTQFYDERSSKRKLRWIHSRGVVTMTALFENGRKFLELTAYQATVLTMFNDSDRVTMSQIKEVTGIPEDEIKRIMASLTSKGYNVLKLLTQEKEQDESMDTSPLNDTEAAISPTDQTYVVNTSFTHKKTKIRIPLPRVTEEESAKTIDSVEGDRAFVLDAAIVRIMKSRKSLKLQLLIQQVLEHVHERFQPDIKLIKKRTESLIDREYLERSETDNQVLVYKA